MFCRNCGNEIHENAVICTKCGCATGVSLIPTVARPAPNPKDRFNFGFFLLGFLSPMIGLILFLIFRDDFPKRAKGAGIAALVSVLLEVLSIILLVLGYFVFLFLLVFLSTPVYY